jgi:non-ribosomal peptide synthetase component F
LGRQSYPGTKCFGAPGSGGGRQSHLINTVPSALEELLDLGVLAAVDANRQSRRRSFKNRAGQAIYGHRSGRKSLRSLGPSETTTYSTFTLRRSEGKATIGRPIANTKIYLLDGALQPVPIGVTERSSLVGPAVACGYLNRPELTAEKFLRNPFSRDPKARLYRSGDLAARRAGNIEYLGRIDNQVKIRGFRIELGENRSRAHASFGRFRESRRRSRGRSALLAANSDNLKSKSKSQNLTANWSPMSRLRMARRGRA